MSRNKIYMRFQRLRDQISRNPSLFANYNLVLGRFRTFRHSNLSQTLIQGRSQELEMGGAKLLGEGVWGPLKAPSGSRAKPGQRSGNHLDKMINNHIGI